MTINTNSRTRTLRTVAAAGGVAAAMFLTFAGSAAAATPAGPQAATSLRMATATDSGGAGHRVGATDGYDLTDLVPYNFQLTKAYQQPGWYGGEWFNGEYPSQNNVSSGYGSSWGITSWWGGGETYYSEPWEVDYQFTDSTGATDTVTLSAPYEASGSGASCSISGPTSSDYNCISNNTASSFYVAAANSQSLSQADRSQFAQSLANLCNGPNSAGGNATCSFKPADNTFHYAVSTQGTSNDANTQAGCYMWQDGNPNPNDENTFTMESSTSESNSFSDSLSESAEFGIDGLAQVGISNSTTWGNEFSHGTSYSNAKQVAANYGDLATPVWFPTVASITGDFTATLGGVTYDLPGVTLSSSGAPDATINGHLVGRSVATVQQVPMTSAQWTQFCGNATPPAGLAR